MSASFHLQILARLVDRERRQALHDVAAVQVDQRITVHEDLVEEIGCHHFGHRAIASPRVGPARVLPVEGHDVGDAIRVIAGRHAPRDTRTHSCR